MLVVLTLVVLGLVAVGWGLAGLLRNKAGKKLPRVAGVVVGLAMLVAAGSVVASFVGGLSGAQVYTYSE